MALRDGRRNGAIERAIALTGSRWVEALLPVLVFGAFHVGIAHAVADGLIQAAQDVARRARRDLIARLR